MSLPHSLCRPSSGVACCGTVKRRLKLKGWISKHYASLAYISNEGRPVVSWRALRTLCHTDSVQPGSKRGERPDEPVREARVDLREAWMRAAGRLQRCEGIAISKKRGWSRRHCRDQVIDQTCPGRASRPRSWHAFSPRPACGRFQRNIRQVHCSWPNRVEPFRLPPRLPVGQDSQTSELHDERRHEGGVVLLQRDVRGFVLIAVDEFQLQFESSHERCGQSQREICQRIAEIIRFPE